MPWDTETYLHRVGRAGRFGTYGLAISIVSGADEVQKLADVSESINCDIVQLPGILQNAFSGCFFNLDNSFFECSNF